MELIESERPAPAGPGPRWLRAPLALVVPLIFLVLGSAVAAWGPAEVQRSATDQLPTGSDSARVAALGERFDTGDEQIALVLFTSDATLSGTALDEANQGLRRAGGVGRLQPSADGTAAIGVVPVSTQDATELAERIDTLRTTLRADAPAGVSVQVTGPAAVQADLAAVFEGADLTLLAVTGAVVAVLLIVTYRSPVLWLVPLLVVGIADRAAAVLATRTLSELGVVFDESTTGILSVLVFGAGTDYALLLISRYRDELRRTESRAVAMAAAWRRTAEAVLSSAVTVFLGLLTLLLSTFPATRGLGLACAIGVVVAAAAVLLVLPPALAACGRWIFWPRRPRVGETTQSDSASVWRRIGDAVARRPLPAIAAVLALLGVLASGALGIRSGLSESDQFLRTPESISAADRLAESFPAGTTDPAIVITRADAAEVTRALEGVPGVDGVRPGGTSADLTRLQVVLDAAPGTPQARDTVTALRTALDGFEDTWVGGTDADDLDIAQASSDDRALIIPLILVLVLVALGLLLRSVVAPILLVATVVATYGAALGLGWWISTGAFGFERLDTGVPLLAFLFLVALGVDYNIFLVTRAAEESRGHGVREGMLRALASTGGVITSAGILLAAVFAVLGVLPLVVLAELGIVICVGVLLDTLLVRTVLVPALAELLGDRFWWPRRLT